MNDHEPAARNNDPDTSHAAAASVEGAQNLRNRLFTLLSTRYPGGLTHEEIIVAYGGYVSAQGWPTATAQGIRSRVKELERDGRVRREDTPTGTTRTGRRSYRWLPVTDPAEQQRIRAGLLAAEREEEHIAHIEMTLVDSLSTMLAPAAAAFAEAHPEIRDKVAEVSTVTTPETLATVDNRPPSVIQLERDILAANKEGAITRAALAQALVTAGWHQ